MTDLADVVNLIKMTGLVVVVKVVKIEGLVYISQYNENDGFSACG